MGSGDNSAGLSQLSHQSSFQFDEDAELRDGDVVREALGERLPGAPRQEAGAGGRR